MVAISFLIIRKKYPEMERPFKIKNYKFVGIMATILSAAVVVMYLIPGTGCTLIWQEWIIVGGWILLGVVFYIWSRIRYKSKFATINLAEIDVDDENSHNKVGLSDTNSDI